MEQYLFLRSLRKEANLSMQKLADQLGTSKTTISQIENNKINISADVLLKYSKYFNIPISILEQKEINTDNIIPQNMIENALQIVNIPYLESLSAGLEEPLVEDGQILDYVSVPVPKNLKQDNIVAIRVNGESMNKIVPNHALAIIQLATEAPNNSIIAYQLGNEFALKRYYKAGSSLVLEPESHDPSFKPRLLTPEEAEFNNFHIIGKLVSIYNDNF